MRKIVNKTNNITLSSRGWNTGANEIIVDCTCPLAAAEEVKAWFPEFTFAAPVDGMFTSSWMEHVGNMPDIKATAECEQSDVGLRGNVIESNFSVAILWAHLGLSSDEWEIVEA